MYHEPNEFVLFGCPKHDQEPALSVIEEGDGHYGEDDYEEDEITSPLLVCPHPGHQCCLTARSIQEWNKKVLNILNGVTTKKDSQFQEMDRLCALVNRHAGLLLDMDNHEARIQSCEIKHAKLRGDIKNLSIDIYERLLVLEQATDISVSSAAKNSAPCYRPTNWTCAKCGKVCPISDDICLHMTTKEVTNEDV